MTFSNQRLKSLRQAVWGNGKDPTPREVGEAVRDLATAVLELAEATFFRIKIQPSVQWNAPYYLSCDHQPSAVVLASVRVAQQPTTLAVGTVSWAWTGTQIRVDAISGVVDGGSYDFVFLIFG